MLSANVKLQTHLQDIRSNLSTSSKIRNKLLLYALFVALYLLFDVYLALRGWQAFSAEIYLPAYIIMLATLMFVMPVAAYLLDQGRQPKLFVKIIAYTGFYWPAFFIYAVLIMLGIDAVRGLDRLLDGRLFQLLPPGLTISRQTGMLLVVGGSLLLLGIGTWLARRPQITHYRLRTAKALTAGRPLRIALLSDIHYGSLVSTANLERMSRGVASQQPDLILLAGDLIDNSIDMMRSTDFIERMAELKAPLGVYAVLGNHELVNAGIAETRAFFAEAGIQVLLDETVEIDGQLVLAGRNERTTEFSGSFDQLSPKTLLQSVDKSKPVVVIQHQPAELAQLAEAGADFALAGHTHAGQLFPLNILNRRKFEQTGPYRCLGGLQSVISDGYGTWGPPIRLGCRSEIIIIDLSSDIN